MRGSSAEHRAGRLRLPPANKLDRANQQARGSDHAESDPPPPWTMPGI